MNIFFTFLLIVVDLCAYYAVLGLAVVARKIIDDFVPSIMEFGFSYLYFIKFWWMPLILVAVIANKGLYTNRLTFFDEAKKMIGAVTFGMVFIFAIISISKILDDVSRLTIVFMWCFGVIIFPIFRKLGKIMLFKINIGVQKIIVVGTGESSRAAAAALLKEKNYGYKLKGFFSVKDTAQLTVKLFDKSYPVLKGDMEKAISDVSDIVFVDNGVKSSDEDSLHAFAQRKARGIITVPEPDRAVMMNSEFHYLFNNKLFVLKSKNNLSSKVNIFIKRLFDIAFTLAVLPFATIIIFVAAVAICIESKGKPFYSHNRIGKGGKTIGVLKIRSMYMDAETRLEEILATDAEKKAEWQSTYKLKDDPRVTKVGKFIRKTSIDEMPQFFNVLKGDMSVVGPRPILKKELEDYYGKDSEYYYMVRPGITGLWQVSGRSDTDYVFRVGLDSWYVINWGMWLDIMIILKTVRAVIKKEGAY